MFFVKKDIHKLLSVMIPILVAQVSTAGVTFINTTMAGHAGADDLAGVSVGAGLFYPLLASIIGLVLMLKRMNDPSTIGPAMAVALLTTFYGAILANLVFNPMAGKLRARSREEVLTRTMIVEGIMSISRGENRRTPRGVFRNDPLPTNRWP